MHQDPQVVMIQFGATQLRVVLEPGHSGFVARDVYRAMGVAEKTTINQMRYARACGKVYDLAHIKAGCVALISIDEVAGIAEKYDRGTGRSLALMQAISAQLTPQIARANEQRLRNVVADVVFDVIQDVLEGRRGRAPARALQALLATRDQPRKRAQRQVSKVSALVARVSSERQPSLQGPSPLEDARLNALSAEQVRALAAFA
jgi:hypothetical protein